MTTSNRRRKQAGAAALLAAVVLAGAACGGGGGSDPVPGVTDAGPDQWVSAATPVTLTGYAEKDPGTWTYTWLQTAGPDINVARKLEGRSPTFTAPATVGVITLELHVSNGKVEGTLDTVTIRVVAIVDHSLFVAVTGDDRNPGTATEPLSRAALNGLNTSISRQP